MNHVVYAISKSLPHLIRCYFSWLNKYAKHPEKTPLQVRYDKSKELIASVLKKIDVPVNVSGTENIPDEAACYFGNHLSAADPIFYFGIMNRPIAFVAKKEAQKIPLVGKIFLACDGLFMDRSNLKQELKVMMKVEERLSKNECSYYIFAEGTRNRDPLKNMLPFKNGAFRSAMKSKRPIVPTVNYGSFRVVSFKHNHTKYPTNIKILKPLYYDDYKDMTTEEVALLVHSMIQKELSFVIRKTNHEQMVEIKNKNYKFNKIY